MSITGRMEGIKSKKIVETLGGSSEQNVMEESQS
jgi:hypothetical protein